MPTPLTPDEEFDALFRQGLEHYPEQPENPAAWHRMDLLLDADLRQQALRRKVLRMLGAESVLLVLLLWAAWFFVGGLPASAPRNGRATASALNPQSTFLATAPAPAPGASQPKSSLPNHPAPAPLPTPLPATEPSAQAAKKQPTAAQEAFTLVGTAPAARPEAAANRHTAPAHHPLATRAATPPHQYGGYLLTDASGHLASTTNKFSSTDSKQQQTRRQPLTAAQATKRQPLQWAATSSQREAKAAHLIINTYLPANSIAHNGHSQARTRRSRLLVADAGFGRGQRLATCQILPTEDGTGVALDKTTIAAERAYFGTAIDLLSPRWPITEPYFALPDSLRPVALAAHPAPTDSLLPRPLVRPYRLQLGLVAAPELSTVRTAHLSPPGTNVGVQLDYRLARRWRLSTAFLYSVKRYGAAGTDYTVPYTMPHGWVIDDVNAVCRIIDIPLNLRYDLWQRSRYQVFASAGLSSLFMKREQYTYDYAPVYGKPVAPYSFEVSNGSRHLLKVLNLSAGYERLLSPRWSVQAEAFAKLPLAGVGYGAVRLRSAGVFFSLRYGLLPGRPAQVPGLR